MIGYDESIALLLACAKPLAGELRAIDASLGYVLARDVISPMALPSFDHAAMDGYALAAGKCVDAGTEHDVQGSQAAGDAERSSSGAALEIMTGAQLPRGLDAVIPVERTELLSTSADGSPMRIRLLEALSAGSNVRLAGSDVAAGAVALKAGVCITPSHVMLIAALGVAQVEVMRRPRVAIVCTGKELQADLSRPLGPGQIYGSNGPYLVAAFAVAGAQVLSCETVDDTAVTYAAAVQRARDAGAELIVSTGAVSMGRYDFVPDALRQLGAELLFHKVAIRPGKPLLGARLNDGVLVIGLPGTPMAVAAGFRFFITPVLRAMRGQGREVGMRAVLDAPVDAKPGLRHFLRGRLGNDHLGVLHVTLSPQQQPFRISPFADANAWVVLPEQVGLYESGRAVEVFGLHVPGVYPFIEPHAQERMP